MKRAELPVSQVNGCTRVRPCESKIALACQIVVSAFCPVRNLEIVTPEITFTQNVFSNLLADGRTRLANAERQRLETEKAIERGEENYRTEWLREAVLKVIDTLGEVARDFNVKHPRDLCTAKDFGDILISTIATLKRAAG